MNPTQGSDRRLLDDFLFGRLPDADAEQVAARLAADPQLLALAEQSQSSDPLVDAVRESADLSPPDDTPPVCDLITRLIQLAPAGPTQTCDAAADTADPTGSRPGSDGLSFLQPPRAADELGRLAGFRILEVLGSGGMGLVLRAEDVQLRRQVALKVIKPERAADPSHRERFLREARAAAALHHDHVMPIHQVGQDNGVLFLAMPLLSGQTLEARLAQQPSLPVAEQVRIGREIALALAAAHERGLIHRDVKPSNVWLEATSLSAGGEGRVKVLDFGLARFAEGEDSMTQAGAIIGTPAYMSPEQADGLPVDGRSDLFSLGCILYRMATGRQPFSRDSVTATLRAVVDHTPPPPRHVAAGVPQALSDLIVSLIAKSPADRPASASVVAATLSDLSVDDSTVEHVSTPRTHAPRRKRLALIGTASLAAVAAVVVLSVRGCFPHDADGTSTRDTSPVAVASSEKKGTEPVATTREIIPLNVPAAPAYTGSVDILVRRETGRGVSLVRLSEGGALPLRPGDRFHIEAKVEPAAYLYLIWIDTDGNVQPIYPWVPPHKDKEGKDVGGWGSRPRTEEARADLELPDRGFYRITDDEGGMHTLLLLARPTQLEDDDKVVQSWFAGLKPQRPIQNERAAVWFEKGRVVQKHLTRGPQFFDESEVDDPVMRLQQLLRDKLQPHAPFTMAVSFAQLGK